MKVIRLEEITAVRCPSGGFTSFRYLLESDHMGFTITKTFIPKGKPQRWHYKNHLEACYCLSGRGILTNNETLKQYDIVVDTLYALDKNDDHFFQAIEDTVLICVFNPPLKGKEVHNEKGVYEI